jgi:hypothetical protein
MYTIGATGEFMDWALDHGYEMEFLDEGVLGYGTFILWDWQLKRNFLVWEIPTTCWTSAQGIREFRDENELPNKLRRMIAEMRQETREREELEEAAHE